MVLSSAGGTVCETLFFFFSEGEIDLHSQTFSHVIANDPTTPESSIKPGLHCAILEAIFYVF